MSSPSSLPPEIRHEIQQRAARYCESGYLEVDYYRVRQKLFFPLPIERIPEKASSVRGLPAYPYGTWLMWSLEERILALGWAVELCGSVREKAAACRDLEALAAWRHPKAPDLQTAHMTRILVSSLQWRWMPSTLRKQILKSLAQLVDDGWAARPTLPAHSVSELISKNILFSNIPTIGATALATAAATCSHPLRADVEARARLMADLWLAWGQLGHLEGVSYDGYTCDFILDWIKASPDAASRKLLAHPHLPRVMEGIRLLGAPGCPENMAPLGDVEPYEMRFHYSFAAKYQHLLKGRKAVPFPTEVLSFVRTDALPYLSLSSIAPVRAVLAGRQSKLQDAHYALVLNAATASPAVKVVVSWSNSLMGHMQPDAGSFVIGAGGEWLLSDPGYRQYMPTSEKDFAMGPGAHNQPLINGIAPSLAPVQRDYAACKSGRATGVRLNLGKTYNGWKGSVNREILLDREGRLLVTDRFKGDPIHTIDYYWHGHPSAFWHVTEGAAALIVGPASMLFTCCDAPLQPQELQRLRGSRGQLSIVKTLRYPKPRKQLTIQWFFEIASGAPCFSVARRNALIGELRAISSSV